MFKLDVRQTTVQYSKYVAQKRKQKLKMYRHRLDSQYKKLAMINLSGPNVVKIIQKTNDKIDFLKAQINKETTYDAQGAMLRPKTKWMSEAEHNTKYFFNLEKKNARAKVMSQTYDDHGKLVNQPERVLGIQASFYEKLYTSDDRVKADIKIKPEQKLSQLEKEELEKPIEMEELKKSNKRYSL